MVRVCLLLWETTKLSSKVAAPLCTPAGSEWGAPFAPHPRQHSRYSGFGLSQAETFCPISLRCSSKRRSVLFWWNPANRLFLSWIIPLELCHHHTHCHLDFLLQLIFFLKDTMKILELTNTNNGKNLIKSFSDSTTLPHSPYRTCLPVRGLCSLACGNPRAHRGSGDPRPRVPPARRALSSFLRHAHCLSSGPKSAPWGRLLWRVRELRKAGHRSNTRNNRKC